MPKAYVVFTEDIHDPEGIKAYAAAARDPIHAHGGTVLVADRGPEVLEGEWFGNQSVVIEFESVEAARGWYDSPEYQAAVALRRGSARTNAVILTAFERPARTS